jgi:hypothetical protein
METMRAEAVHILRELRELSEQTRATGARLDALEVGIGAHNREARRLSTEVALLRMRRMHGGRGDAVALRAMGA